MTLVASIKRGFTNVTLLVLLLYCIFQIPDKILPFKGQFAVVWSDSAWYWRDYPIRVDFEIWYGLLRKAYLSNSFKFSMLWLTRSLKNMVCEHCVKIAQIRSFFWSVFSCNPTEYGNLLSGPYFPLFRLNTEIYWSKYPYLVRIQENTDQKKLSIYTLFMQWRFSSASSSVKCLQTYSNEIYQNGAPLENCFGFVDGAWMTTYKLKENQIIIYNYHKRGPCSKVPEYCLTNQLDCAHKWSIWR